ncbi:MAG: Bro-N domain-containing protein, partial [Ktedonobacterales bacterium]
MDNDMTIDVLEEQADATVRRAEIDGIWYFSVVDVIALLTDAPKPRQYWFDMKRYIQTEGFIQLSEKVRQLKLPSSDGKRYRTDAADVETMLRIIQSVPSPKAEPIKQWLAKVGAKKLERRQDAPTAPQPNSAIAVAWTTNRPSDDDLLGWASFLERLAIVYREQASLESRVRYLEQDSITKQQRLDILEQRVARLETDSATLPELFERLMPERLSPLHQQQLRRYETELVAATGWHPNMVYQDILTQFSLGSFS